MALGGGQRGRRDRGAAAVELAIVLPLLIALFLGIVEFSIMMYDKAVITSASRNGARFGTMWSPSAVGRPSCDDIDANSGANQPVHAYEAGLVTFDNAAGARTITVTCLRNGTAVTGSSPICTQDGHEVLTVRASFSYRFLLDPLHFISLFYRNTEVSRRLTKTLVSETVMRCE